LLDYLEAGDSTDELRLVSSVSRARVIQFLEQELEPQNGEAA
jgi:hypothetical protein